MELIDELREGLNRQGTALVELSMQIDKQEISIVGMVVLWLVPVSL